jgi:Uncharacterised protein family (UPF0183)
LGASLHDVLTRLKAEPQTFPIIDLIYDLLRPIEDPVIVNLPKNGLRLRFDGKEQRLRLIEVIDFSRSKLSYNNIDIAKPPHGQHPTDVFHPDDSQSGPTFRHVYNKLLGLAFPAEYMPPAMDDGSGYGVYVLSYPGIAFTFPFLHSAWRQGKDSVSLLSSSAAKPAASMAIFDGESWTEVRSHLYSQPLKHPRNYAPVAKARETYPDEIGLVRINGEGWLEMERPWATDSFHLRLGQTTPQELVAELGPPDAIYRKNDQRMQIHKTRDRSHSRTPSKSDARIHDDSTDTDHSSAHTGTDVSEDESEVESGIVNAADECFYNYFYDGFDILISPPTAPSRCPPSLTQMSARDFSQGCLIEESAPLVATKIILHSNIPGSYCFNRHRRCRWDISYLSSKAGRSSVTSETPFKEISKLLQYEWNDIYANEEEATQRQRGMVLNRGWGVSPGSSCELLGGWEESQSSKRVVGPSTNSDDDNIGLGNTTLYGFPGLVFEVLKNGFVSGLTVF